jgi:uncharacterized protein (DUF302 family)
MSLIKKVMFLLVGIIFLSSCSGIQNLAWTSSDPWEDDEEKTVNFKTKKGKLEIKETQIPDIYERSADLSIDEADLLIRSELESKNIKIVHVLHISRGVKEQGYKDFWEDMRIYLACNLSKGYVIMKHNPQLVGWFPCRIYTYRNKEGKLVIGMVKPSIAIRYMGNPDIEAIKVLKELDKAFKEIIDSIVENQ